MKTNSHETRNFERGKDNNSYFNRDDYSNENTQYVDNMPESPYKYMHANQYYQQFQPQQVTNKEDKNKKNTIVYALLTISIFFNIFSLYWFLVKKETGNNKTQELNKIDSKEPRTGSVDSEKSEKSKQVDTSTATEKRSNSTTKRTTSTTTEKTSNPTTEKTTPTTTKKKEEPKVTTKEDALAVKYLEYLVKDFETTKEEALDLSYYDAMRNPDDYVGELVVSGGEVVQVLENVYRVAGDYIWGGETYKDQIWYVEYKELDRDKILEGDIVNFYGMYYGVSSYKSVMGATIYVPTVVATYHEIFE